MKIKLWDLEGYGIIIKCKSGIIYLNQTGGTACYDSEVEGAFCPLIDEAETQIEKLGKLTTNKSKITPKEADEIDSILSSNPDTKFIKVDREKLSESWESWLHVIVDSEQSVCIEYSSSISAILTWPNSD